MSGPTHHPDLEFVSGDDWIIPFTLTDADGDAINLDGLQDQIEWTLLDPNGLTCTDLVDVATITVTAPTNLGQGTVTVPASATFDLDAGRYHDAIRLPVASAEITEWVGAIDVDANPFAVGSDE